MQHLCLQRPLTVLALVVSVACARAAAPPDVDTIYFNGQIVTVDANFSIAQALAVSGERVAAVGSNAEIRGLATRATRLIDLKGRTVLPGFNESHAHISAGDSRTLDWNHLQNFAALKAALTTEIAKRPRGSWILAQLKNESFPEQTLFHRAELDAIAPDHAVVLMRGAHAMIINSLAVKLAQITRASKPAPGGSVELDAKGEPNGVLRESAAWRLVFKHVPPSEPDAAASRDRILAQLNELPQYGITSNNIPGMRPNELRHLQDLYAAQGENLVRSTVQIRMNPGFDQYDDLDESVRETIHEIEGLAFHTGMGNDRLKLGAIKMSIDGGLTGQGFWTIDPYPKRPGFTGTVRIPEQALYPVAKRAHELGWQLGIHAIGDAAVKMTVDVLARVLTESPRPNARHYVHHISVMPPEETLATMAKFEIIASSQPNFEYALNPYAVAAMDGPKLQSNNPQMTLVRRGIRLAYGSDGMPLGPLVGIYAAVTRRGLDGKVYGPEEKMSVQDAIRAYTMGTAYVTFDEGKKGSLEAGKYADMVILAEDVLTVDPEHIKDIKVEKTIVGNRVIYDATSPKPAAPY